MKLGMRAAELVALILSAACGTGAGSSGNAQQEAGATAVDGGSSIDGGSTCAVGCDESEAGAAGDAGHSEGGPAGDANGVFVATTGSDTAPGTMAKPVLTIGKGVQLAQATHKDLYVCNGAYAENVVIDTKSVNVHGGYDCTKGWALVDDKPTIAPQTGVPLTVRSVSSAMTIERLQLQAADASTNSASSIAAVASSCSELAFKQVVFQAGAGASGAQGQSPEPILAPAYEGKPGTSIGGALCPAPGNKPPSSCDTIGYGGYAGLLAGWGKCSTVGGHGGDGANVEVGYAGTRPGPGSGGAGTTIDGAGADGAPGANGKDGVTSSSAKGTFTSTGYVASNAGTDGEPGQPGGSGGGGMGGGSDKANIPQFNGCTFVYIGAGGGEGGWGGCGGGAGGAGGGGGASLGLVAYESTVTVEGCQVNTSAGGDGGSPGKGVDGEPGGAGGAGGIGEQGGGDPQVCINYAAMGGAAPGGAGARGGRGGNGGAGGGGPSIGIVVVGAPQPDTTTVDFNIATGGLGGQAFSGPNAPGGLSTQVLVLVTGDGGATAVDAATDK
jgi:hypothetical protein